VKTSFLAAVYMPRMPLCLTSITPSSPSKTSSSLLEPSHKNFVTIKMSPATQISQQPQPQQVEMTTPQADGIVSEQPV
jgi:hypothetical protein